MRHNGDLELRGGWGRVATWRSVHDVMSVGEDALIDATDRSGSQLDLVAATGNAEDETSSMTVWMNRIFSSTRAGRTNGYRSSRPMERFTMFSDHASGNHKSMRVSSALGPRTRRLKVAPAGRARTLRRGRECRGCAGSGRRFRPSPRRDAWWRKTRRS